MYCNYVTNKLRQTNGTYDALRSESCMLSTRTFADYKCNEFLLYHGSQHVDELCAEGISLALARNGYFGFGFYMCTETIVSNPRPFACS